MKKVFFTVLTMMVLLLSSNMVFAQDDYMQDLSEQDTAKVAQEKIQPWTDLFKTDIDPESWQWTKSEETRFVIQGDWDGDGFNEFLFENNNTLTSDNEEITPLKFGGDLGVFFLINEGDLDGDGGDEISFMSANRDYSNYNVIRVWTYTGNRWRELFQSKMHLWDCPNYNGNTPQERFTYEWKRKNGYSTKKVVLKKHEGVINVIGINDDDKYAIEEIRLLDKFASKRKWVKIIQPRED